MAHALSNFASEPRGSSVKECGLCHADTVAGCATFASQTDRQTDRQTDWRETVGIDTRRGAKIKALDVWDR